MELQHYVSKFIVKKWAVNDGHLNLVCRDEYHPGLVKLRRGPAHCFCWPDLYTIRARIETLSLTRFLEHDAPSIVEPHAAKLIQYYTESPYIRFLKVNEERAKLIIRSLIRLHFVRHPESIKWALLKFSSLVDDKGRSLPEAYKALGNKMDSIDDLIRYLLGATLAQTDPLEAFEKADFLFYRLSKFSNEAFLLSDTLSLPSFQLDPFSEERPKGVVIIPVSPSSAIIISSISHNVNHIVSLTDREIVRWTNKEIISRARYAIASPNSQLTKFVYRHFKPKFYYSYKTKTFLHEDGNTKDPTL